MPMNALGKGTQLQRAPKSPKHALKCLSIERFWAPWGPPEHPVAPPLWRLEWQNRAYQQCGAHATPLPGSPPALATRFEVTHRCSYHRKLRGWACSAQCPCYVSPGRGSSGDSCTEGWHSTVNAEPCAMASLQRGSIGGASGNYNFNVKSSRVGQWLTCPILTRKVVGSIPVPCYYF